MELTDEITDMPPELYVEPKTLENHVFEALGHASVCWSEPPKGEFDSLEATKAGETLMRHINTDVPHACGVVFKALREDPDYYQAWQANIAMAFVDHYTWAVKNEELWPTASDVRRIANEAAKNFLNLLIKPIDQ